MPAKRKDEIKSATDVEIDAAYDAMMKGESAVQNCKDAMADLVFHATRLKQLESELAPRESEYKAVIEKFQRLIDGCCAFRKQRGPGVHIAAALSGAFVDRSRTNQKPGTPRGRIGALSSPPSESIANDDKELNRFLSQAVRDMMVSVLQPIFLLPRTPNEIHNAAVLQAKIEEVLAGGQITDSNRPSSGGPQGRLTPRKKATLPPAHSIPMSQQALRPEPAILPPPGIDPLIHAEVLKLREQRISIEKGAEDLQTQILLSRDTLQRRKEEGSGTKAALKKAEKDLIALTKAHNALRLKKEEEDIIKRREEAAAALRKSEDKRKK